MAEEKSTPTEASAAPAKGGKRTLIIIAALMAVEGVGVFFAAKMFTGAPAPAAAAETADDEHPAEGAAKQDAAEGGDHAAAEGGHAAESSGGHDKSGEKGEKSEKGDKGEKGEKSAKIASVQTEIELPECRPSNRMTGKLLLFRMHISILVATPQGEKAKSLVDANKSRISDRINFVLRSADPSHLNEPGLETIKRRIKQELDRILGDDKMVQEVLIPELLQSGYGL